MITGKIIEKLPVSLRKKIENSNELRNIIGNVNWLTFENIFKSVLNIVILALLARHLGPTRLGIITYAYAFVTLFSGLSTLGMDSIVVREIINKEKESDKYLGTAFILKMAGSVALILISLAVISFTKSGDSVTLLFVLIVALGYLFKPFDTIDFWFQSKVESKYSVIARTFAFFIISALKIAFIYLNSPLIYFVYLYSLEFAVTAFILIFFYVKTTKTSLFQWKFDKNTAKLLFIDSWPLFLGAITSMIYMKIDQVMIGNILGEREVSFYYTAVKLSETWYFFPTVVGASVFPAILNAKKISEEKYKYRLQKLLDMSTWAGIIVAVFITLTARFIVKVLYGDEYSITADVLSVHIWSGVFVFSGIIASKWVVTENLTKNALVRSVIGTILSIIFYYIFINRYGIVGAAIATLLSYAFVNYLSLAFWKKTRECFIMQTKAFNIFRIINIGKVIKYISRKATLLISMIYYEIQNIFSSKVGISDKSGLIVSITSYPKRFNVVHLTLESLLNQTMKPEKVIIWLSKDEASDEVLPKKILKLKKRGLSIEYVEGNIRSYKKLIYSLQRFGDKAIVTVDDDTIYPRDFLEKIYKTHLENKNDIIAYRCTYMKKTSEKELAPYLMWKEVKMKESSFNLFPTGAGGILYPPKCLDNKVFDTELFMKICPTADDVWFKAMGMLNGRKIRMVGGESKEFPSIKSAQKDSLWKINVDKDKNDEQLKKVFDYFDLYKYIE